jgi:hypothetical protein
MVDSLHTGEFMEVVTETDICSRLHENNYRHNELQAPQICVLKLFLELHVGMYGEGKPLSILPK